MKKLTTLTLALLLNCPSLWAKSLADIVQQKINDPRVTELTEKIENKYNNTSQDELLNLVEYSLYTTAALGGLGTSLKPKWFLKNARSSQSNLLGTLTRIATFGSLVAGSLRVTQIVRALQTK